MKTVLLWLGFAVCIMSGLLLAGLPVKVLLQPTAAVIVLVPVVLYLLYSYGSGVGPFLGRAVRQDLQEDDSLIIETASALGFLFGIIGMVVGFVMVMSNISDASKLGAGIAASIISIFYGAVPSIVLLPLRTPARNKLCGSDTTQKAAGFLVISFFMMTTDLFVVLYAMR